LLIACPAILLLAACTNENAENISKKDTTSTEPISVSGITLSVDVNPIFEKYDCYTCHGASTANSIGGGIALQPYESLKRWVDNGKLYGSIAHLRGYEKMPKGGGKMTDLELAKVKWWIDNGAKND
jgi:hypothetical protein